MVKDPKDYVDEIYEKFPQFSKSEILRIIDYGLRYYVYAAKLHCDVIIKSNANNNNLIAFCGLLSNDTKKHFKRWLVKWKMRERYMWKVKGKKWDGYYYIGVTQLQHDKIKNKKVITFKDAYFHKVKEELYHIKGYKHIWRVPFATTAGWKFFVSEYRTDKAEYVEPNRYESEHKHLL